jgi:hypothetical protein
MKNTLAIGIIGILLFCEGITQADPITIQISGNVTSASGSALPGSIHSGVSFSGTYTYDSSTADSGGGHYVFDAPYGIDLFSGGYEFKTASNHVDQFEISILDNYAPYGNVHDDYWVKSYENSSLSNGELIDYIGWTLLGSTTIFSSSDLPDTAPILSQWSINRLEIYGPESSLYIQGTVTQAILIPEPLTGMLFVIGTFFLRLRK